MTTATRTIRIVIDSSGATPQINRITQDTERATFSVNKLAAAISSALAINQLKEFSDEWIQIQNQLGRTSQSTADLANTTATLLDVANQTRQGLQSTVNLYGTLRMSTESLGYSQEQAVAMTKTINQLLLVGGKTAAQTAGAMYQLSLGLQAGALRGDEFNSVAEGAPDIMRALQRELGMTQGELREFAATGGITAKILASAISNYADIAEEAAKKTKATFEQNAAVAKNNAIAWVGASDLIIGANSLAGESLVFLSQNIDKLINIAGIAAGIYVTRLIPSIAASTAAMGANLAATYAATMETIRYNTALANLAANATIAQRATLGLTNAAVAARGAMSVLFGPVGLILAGVAALAYLATGSDGANKSLVDLNQTVDQTIDKFEKLGAAGQRKYLNDLNLEIVKTRKEITDAGKELDSALKPRGRAGVNYTDVTNARAEVERLNEQLKTLIKTRDELNKDSLVKDAEKLQKGIKFDMPNLDGGTEDANKGLEAGYAAAEEAARQHKKNLEDIQPEHDAEVASEGKMWDQVKEVQDVNKSMELELASRLQVAQFYRDAEAVGVEGSYARELALINAMAEEKRAIASQRASEDLQKSKDQEAEALVQVGANEQARDLIINEYATQREIAAAIHAANLAAINKKAADDQKRLDEAAAKAKYDTFIGMGQDLMNAAQGQSKKLFHASREAAVASAIIDSGKSALAAWRKGMESGGPWTAAGFAAASLLKTVPMVQKLKNSSYSGGGGSMSMGSGSAAISQMPTTATSNEPAFEQKKVIELRGITPETLLSGQQFIDALTSTGAVVAMNNAQAQAQRIGVI